MRKANTVDCDLRQKYILNEWKSTKSELKTTLPLYIYVTHTHTRSN